MIFFFGRMKTFAEKFAGNFPEIRQAKTKISHQIRSAGTLGSKFGVFWLFRVVWDFLALHTTKQTLFEIQKTQEGCGCFWGLCGSSGGKFRENCWKNLPESPNATNSRISGTGKGKPAGNLGPTLPGPCPHLPCGVFFEIDSSSLLEFF